MAALSLAHFGSADIMVVVIGAAACAWDVTTRRLPNLLTLGGAAVGLLCAVATHGVQGLLVSVAGWAVGLAVFLPLFLLRGLGAGDVKLMACIGAWLGPALAFWSAMYAAIAGGVLALVVALAGGYVLPALSNVYLLLAHFRVAGVRPHPELTLERGTGPRLPYAVPIAAGTLAALFLR